MIASQPSSASGSGVEGGRRGQTTGLVPVGRALRGALPRRGRSVRSRRCRRNGRTWGVPRRRRPAAARQGGGAARSRRARWRPRGPAPLPDRTGHRYPSRPPENRARPISPVLRAASTLSIRTLVSGYGKYSPTRSPPARPHSRARPSPIRNRSGVARRRTGRRPRRERRRRIGAPRGAPRRMDLEANVDDDDRTSLRRIVS